MSWIERALQVVGEGGVVALAGLMLVENLFPPIPSEAVLPLAGMAVNQGTIGLASAVVFATLGSVLGAVVLYGLGRWGGRPLLLRWHPVLRLDADQLDRADDWFDRHGAKLVFWARMVPFARSVVSVPAGASEMRVGRFCLLTAAGSAIWNAVLIGAGLALGSNWQAVSRVMSTYQTVAIVAVSLAGVAAVVWWWRDTHRDEPS